MQLKQTPGTCTVLSARFVSCGQGMHSLRACSISHMQAEWETKDSQQVKATCPCAHVLLTVLTDSVQLHFACTDVTAVGVDFPRNLACIAQSTSVQMNED